MRNYHHVKIVPYIFMNKVRSSMSNMAAGYKVLVKLQRKEDQEFFITWIKYALLN